MTLLRRPSPWAPVAAALAGTVVAVLAADDAGSKGALSALLGAGVAIGFFAAGALPLLVVRGQEQSSRALGAGVLLLTYTLRLFAAVLVLSLARRSDAVDERWTGFAVIACALAWVTGQAVAVLRRTRA